MNLIITTILRSVIPAILVFVGKNDFVWNFSSELFGLEYDYSGFQTISFAVGLIWASLVIPVQLAQAKRKLDLTRKQKSHLQSFGKKLLLEILGKELRRKNLELRIRIFKPIRGKFRPFGKYTKLQLIYLPGISDILPAEDLVFKITPTPEGLVGRAYASKGMIIDMDVAEKDEYLIPKHLQDKVHDVRFCCAIPLYKDTKIIAVMGFDSPYPMEVNEKQRKALIQNLKRISAFALKSMNNNAEYS